jgi:uncharacterized membrane protein YfcA
LINIVFLILALLAEILGTVGGFGSSVFFVPFANFYFDFHTVLGLTALFHLSSNFSKIWLFRKGLNWKIILNIGIPSVVFVIIGGVLSKFIDTVYLQIALSVFLITFSLLFLIKKDLVFKTGRRETWIGGSLSGFFAGLLGTGGAIRGLTMAAFNLEKSIFVATSAAIDMGIDLARSFVYFFNGYLNKTTLIYIPFLLIIGFIGTYIGKFLLSKISQVNFKTISLILIMIIGLIMATQSLINTYY